MLETINLDWSNLIGHDEAWQKIKNLKSGAGRSLPQVMLFSGRAGIGKRLFVAKLTALWACDSVSACGQCQGCLKVQSFEHDDILWVDSRGVLKAEDASQVKSHLALYAANLEYGDSVFDDHVDVEKSAMPRIVVISNIERLNHAAANRLLKTLEEPPEGSLIFMTTDSLKNVIETIRSRAVVMRLQPPKPSLSLAWLKAKLSPQEVANARLSDEQWEQLLRRHSYAPGSAFLALQDILQGGVSEKLDQMLQALLKAQSYQVVMDLGLKLAKEHSLAAADFCDRMEIALNEKYRALVQKSESDLSEKAQMDLLLKLQEWRRLLSECRQMSKKKNVPINAQLLADVFGMIALNE